MRRPSGKKIVLLTSSGPRRRAEVIASWARALLPTAVLVVNTIDVAQLEAVGQDAIALDAEEVASGPLSLADAIAKVATGSSR
jgi:hypothetical protein